MLSLHHVNVGVPTDGLDAEADFLVGVLGLRHIEPGPDVPPMANWFEADAGVQIHVSLDPNHHAPERAHVAFVLGDALPAVEERIVERGLTYRAVGDASTGRRLVCNDPAGNIWELRAD